MSKNLKSSLILFIALALILIAGTFLLNKQSPESRESELLETQSGILGGSIEQAPNGKKIYSDADYGFSFEYPETMSVGAFSDAPDTKTILVRETGENAAAPAQAGIQIYISAFGEDIALSAERIKKDVPDMKMDNVQTISIGQELRFDLKGSQGRTLTPPQAVSFESGNVSAGESREVWFVYKSNLYQISAPRGSEPIFSDILETWKWSAK